MIQSYVEWADGMPFLYNFVVLLRMKYNRSIWTCLSMGPIGPIGRDQLNSRFHGRDIFREIDLLPWKTLISVKSVIFR